MHRIDPALHRASRLTFFISVKAFSRIGTALGSLFILAPALVLGEVGIQSFNDLHLGSWTGTGALEASDELCIYRSDNPNYRIVVSGNGPGGSFVLSRDAATTIPYSAYFRGSLGGYVAMDASQGNTFCCATDLVDDCAGTTNAAFQIRISEAALRAAKRGSYSGIITIELEPN